MIFALLTVIVVIALAMAVHSISTAVARNVVNHMDRSPASGSIDQT